MAAKVLTVDTPFCLEDAECQRLCMQAEGLMQQSMHKEQQQDLPVALVHCSQALGEDLPSRVPANLLHEEYYLRLVAGCLLLMQLCFQCTMYCSVSARSPQYERCQP